MGGTMAIQTQCCLYTRDEDDLETDDEAGAREGGAACGPNALAQARWQSLFWRA